MASERPYAVGDWVVSAVGVENGHAVLAMGRIARVLGADEVWVNWGFVVRQSPAYLQSIERERDVAAVSRLTEHVQAGLDRFTEVLKEAVRDGE